MEETAAFFQNDMNYTQFINRTINGKACIVHDEGTPKAPRGDFKIHAVCISLKFQLSGKTLSHILQYGVAIFDSCSNWLIISFMYVLYIFSLWTVV